MMTSLLSNRRIVFLCLLFPLHFIHAQVSTSQVDWSAFLAQHDLVWNKIPADYYSGAILGNGLLGTNIYADKEGSYRWDIGRSDVNEMRPGGSVLYNKARLLIGNFVLKPVGKVTSEEMRLTLYDAIASGKFTTDKGSIGFRTYVDANHDVICIDTETTNAEQGFDWTWQPEKAVSPRTLFAFTHSGTPQDYINNPNPEVELSASGDIRMSVQELHSGYAYVTAWTIDRQGSNRRIRITVSFEPSRQKAIDKATQTLRRYNKKASENLVHAHKAWWNAYYPSSFISFPDARIESFYWIQQYKLACLTRADKLIIDLMGPWPYRTPWPAIWWNLNIQLTYSPLFTANRLELSEPVWRSLNDNQAALIANVQVPEWRKDAAAIGRSSSYDLDRTLYMNQAKQNMYEVGNLTWMMFYYWQYCTHKPDNKELTRKFYPLLKRCIAYYEHILYKGEDGKYHLPLTASPEYKPAEDCNYDLALLRWGAQTLLDINSRHNLKDPKQAIWNDILAHLTDYPVDPEQGFMIGRNVRLESSHRHYSHLLMIYPLGLLDPDVKENRQLILRSLNHWLGMKGALQGYTYTGASSIYSLLGDGTKAAECIEQLLNKYIQPNTLYKETGPVIETPLSAVTSLQEMYLQQRKDRVIVFPAVPARWQDVSFVDLRSTGGFLISATRKLGTTEMIQIKATQAGTCTIQTGMNPDELSFQTPGSRQKPCYRILDSEKGLIAVELDKGETVIMHNASYCTCTPLYRMHPQNETNSFGKTGR